MLVDLSETSTTAEVLTVDGRTFQDPYDAMLYWIHRCIIYTKSRSKAKCHPTCSDRRWGVGLICVDAHDSRAAQAATKLAADLRRWGARAGFAHLLKWRIVMVVTETRTTTKTVRL